MGVAEDELLAYAVGHVVQVEAALLLLNGGVEHHLEQHVTQLLLEVLGGLLVDGLGHLVGLLQEVAADGLMGLLGIPLAAAGGPQHLYNVNEILDVVLVLERKIYHTITYNARII